MGIVVTEQQDRAVNRASSSTAGQARLVTGIFDTHEAAEDAVHYLIRYGRSREDISMMMSDTTRTKQFGFENRTQAAETAGLGSAIGGTAGAIIAAIAAAGTNVILPGLGLVVAGPLAAALAGAGAGGAAGGIIGALVGAGIPEHRARVYDTGLRKGGILLGVEVRSGNEAEIVEALLKQCGATGIKLE